MQRTPKKGFKLGTREENGIHIITRAIFEIDEEKRTTTCTLFEEEQRRITDQKGVAHNLSLSQIQLSRAKVTCKKGDKYDIAQGKLFAFTEALDRWSLKKMKEAERAYKESVKINTRIEDALLVRFKSYERHGR